MFDIIRSIKKITGLHKKEQVEIKDPEQPPVEVLSHKIDKISNFFDSTWAYIAVEFEIIREKFKDLSKANYDLGMKHLDEGNIKEAIFRFKITKKFWPNNYEAYYQLIYCLFLEHEFEAAQKIIDELLEKNPSYKAKIDQLLSPPEEDDLAEPEEDYAKNDLNRSQEDNLENPNQQK